MLRNSFLLIFLFSLVFSPLFGQYSLQEVGLTAGAGISVPMEPKGSKPGLGWHAKVFFSHYTCGKRYGIHADLGFRSGTVELPWTAFDFGVPREKLVIGMNWIDGGFYFKIRPHVYHRPVEPALLAGIKLSYSPYVTFNRSALQSSTGISVNPFQPGIHVSAWLKRKIGAQSFFVQPGIEFYPLVALSLPKGNVSGMYAFIGLGYSLWNSKSHKPSRG